MKTYKNPSHCRKVEMNFIQQRSYLQQTSRTFETFNKCLSFFPEDKYKTIGRYFRVCMRTSC